MPPAPGETLHPGLEPIFARLGVLDSLVSSCSHRHQGIWVEWDGPRRFEPYGENAHGAWSGFQVDRKQLRNSLLAAAVELGTEVRYCRPQRLLIDDTGVKGVIARGCELRARWTVDATGRKAWPAQNLGLAPIRCGPPMFATFGWRTTTDPDLAGQPRIRADQRGWTWTAPLGETRTAWVGLVVGNPAHPSQSQVGTNVSWHI